MGLSVAIERSRVSICASTLTPESYGSMAPFDLDACI